MFDNNDFLIKVFNHNYTYNDILLINDSYYSNEKFLYYNIGNSPKNDIDINPNIISYDNNDDYQLVNDCSVRRIIKKEYVSYKDMINKEVKCIVVNDDIDKYPINIFDFLNKIDKEYTYNIDSNKTSVEEIASCFHIFIQVLNEKDCEYGLYQNKIFDVNMILCK